MHGGAHTSSEVGWARSDVAEMLVVSKLGLLFDLSSGDGESLEDLADVGSLLHGDDSELVLFVDPHEEGFGIVVEDTTGLRPLTLESAALEVLVTTLEKEVVLDELLLLGVGHGGEGVVLALKFTGEFLKNANDLGLDFTSLLSGDGGSEGVVSKVTSDTDSGGVDHPVLVGGEVGASQLGVVHVGDVLVGGAVTVVLLDDLVEQRGEGVESLVAAGVDTDTRVNHLATGEDALLESIAILVFLILALVPDIPSQSLREERFGARGEVRELRDLTGVLEMIAHHHAVRISLRTLPL